MEFDDLSNSGWLGRPPATKVEIDELEESLNVVLPPSYRDFLLTSNGWELQRSNSGENS
jgi:cell wall assembly regulator SMI1